MKIFKFVSKIILSLLVIVLVIIGAVKMQNRCCENIQVNLHYEGTHPTLTAADIIDMINHAKIPTLNTPIKEIKTGKITEIIAKHPYIQTVNKTYFAGTKLIIDITLKELLFHLYLPDKSQYFVTTEGELLPFSIQVKEKLLIVNGHIRGTNIKQLNKQSTSTLFPTIVELAGNIKGNDYYKAQFDQIFINEKQEIELVSTAWNHVILFGNGENSQEKLSNVYQTYKNALCYLGMNNYTTIDARYKNKIIAKK